jgi:hypothetical protein
MKTGDKVRIVKVCAPFISEKYLVAMIIFTVLHFSPFLTGWLSCLVYTLTFNYFEENDKMQG